MAIARALAPRPSVLLCDEPVSSLDAELAASVVDLLGRLQRDLGLTLVFVTHDLALVPRVADRVVVMAAGRIVEQTAASELLTAQHPATRRLLDALPERLSSRRSAYLPRGGKGTPDAAGMPRASLPATRDTVRAWGPSTT